MHVVAAVLRRHRRGALIAKRPPGKPATGRWEFPAGKIECGESHLAALRRELEEELCVDIGGQPRHFCTSRSGRLAVHVYEVCSWTGTPHAAAGQELAWRSLAAVDALSRDACVPSTLVAAAHMRARTSRAR